MINTEVMNWYIAVAAASAIICIFSLGYHLIRLVKAGNPKDYSSKRGNTGAAVRYAMTGAMNPAKKESAYLHLPTYTAGIIYHIGTFISIPVFFIALFSIGLPQQITTVISGFLLLSGISGLTIFFKRSLKKDLRFLSNPDDYISNMLVTILHFTTALYLFTYDYSALYFLSAAALLLYLPLGKLRHAVYFFAARYHLGFFYGWRGVWPPR